MDKLGIIVELIFVGTTTLVEIALWVVVGLIGLFVFLWADAIVFYRRIPIARQTKSCKK